MGGLASRALPKFRPGDASEQIFPVRVKKIILDDSDSLFKEFGEWNSIGLIFFEDSKNPSPDFEKNNFAKPLFPNIKNYPLENEIVYLIQLPTPEIQDNPAIVSYYYFTPINIWNSVHHNAVPDNIYGELLPESQQKDYQQTSEGNVRRVTDGGTDITLGKTFKEEIKIKSLLPYEGDMIIEGRFGNSIRIGSSVSNAKIKNNWSEIGNGDPIMIIRNGQHDNGQDPWVPIIEDINKDKSSIYLTSTQKIPLDVISKEYKSYDNQPENPKDYQRAQLIFSSGRLLLNAYEDSILLSSKKSINLNSRGTINIDSKDKMVVNSPKIFLGSKDATEPLLLGNKTEDLLQKLLSGLKELCDVLPTVGTPNPGTPNIAVANSAIKLSTTITQLVTILPKIKSIKNYTL